MSGLSCLKGERGYGLKTRMKLSNYRRETIWKFLGTGGIAWSGPLLVNKRSGSLCTIRSDVCTRANESVRVLGITRDFDGKARRKRSHSFSARSKQPDNVGCRGENRGEFR